MERKVGSRIIVKFFCASAVSCYGFQVAMGPATAFSRMHLRGWCPSYVRIDCLEDGEQMGADFMAGALWYFLMCYYGFYWSCMFRATCDGLYYGP